MSLVEKLIIKNTIESDRFFKQYLFGIILSAAVIFVSFFNVISEPTKTNIPILMLLSIFIGGHSLVILPKLLKRKRNIKSSEVEKKRSDVLIYINSVLIIMSVMSLYYSYGPFWEFWP